MTARRDLAESVALAERDIDRLFKPLSESIGAIVTKHARDTPDGPRIDAAARSAILRDVDTLLNSVYPKRRGGRSALEDVIVARSNDARMKPIDAACNTIRSRVDDPLFAAMSNG